MNLEQKPHLTHSEASIDETPSRVSATRAAELERRLVKLTRLDSAFTIRLKGAQGARLWIAGLFFVGLAIATIRPKWQLELGLIPAFVISFGYFVLRTISLRRHSRELSALKVFYERQRLRILGVPSGRRFEHAVKRSAHDMNLNRDLGVLGAHSLFTLIDETLTDHGERRLIDWLQPKPRSLGVILERQTRIQNLRSEAWFYTRLTLIASAEDFHISSERILEFVKRPFVGASFPRLFAAVLTVWFLMLVAVGLHWLDLFAYAVPVVVGFAALNMWAIGQVGPTFKKGVGLDVHLGVLGPIFSRIEARARRSHAIKDLFPVTSEAGPARQANRLTYVLSILGVETNPLLSLLINVFVPWSLTGTYLLEKRRAKLYAVFPACLEELAEFEVIGSAVLLDHYQTKTYPRFQEEICLQVRGVFHPLILRAQVVANDFKFPEHGHAGGVKSLGLLTGSNMAGKSTFLRTMGVNQLLAQMGAPVFAAEYLTHPFQVETCIEVSDSLRDGFSYFYAEVRRLRDLLRESESGVPVLYLIDEIFRGTNNRERHIGSRAVIKHLAKRTASVGFISTHDLELVGLEQTESRLMNLHFREDFEAGQMVFHYKLNHGPCPTSNALKIMQAEGIVIDDL